MVQNIPQFQRSLLRNGSIALLIGAIIAIVSTIFHASTEDPANHVLVFTTYASDESWIAVHIGQFAGVVMVFAGGFIALSRLLVQSGSSTVHTLAWIGLALAIMTASAFAVLQAVDGIGNKLAIDSWVTAPSDNKTITFGVAEGVRFVEIGANTYFRILQGTVAVIFGIAILKNKIISRWVGGAGVVMGSITIYAGLEVAYLGFSGLTTEIGISMIIYFVWVGIIGGSMWKKSTSMLE
ncbi:MAG TPA: hypothetical protein VD815_04810 [Candidatus Saccharimonadales bacterium]|nr:hypothetical protein [Candidatus Saccharimonadales bacterium]